jgi:hypothetical protein
VVLHGTLSTTQKVIYRVPEDRRAIVCNLSFVNGSTTNAREFALWIAKKSQAATRITRTTLAAAAANNQNSWTIAEERWPMEAGVSLEAVVTAGSDIDWSAFIVEIAE